MTKFSEISPFFNPHDSSLDHHVNAVLRKKLRNSSIVYHKTKNPFGGKISINTSFLLFLHVIRVKFQEDELFCSLNFSDVM